jgi:hypothetical protein
MKRVCSMEKPPVTSPLTRRTSERSRETLFVSYTIASDVPAEYTETYDIATGGLAMLTNAMLNRDLEISIELELRNAVGSKLRLTGSVRWSTYDPLLQKYRTGVSFTQPSAEFQHEILLYIETLQDIHDLGR